MDVVTSPPVFATTSIADVTDALTQSSNLLGDNSSLVDDSHCGRNALTNSYGWFVQILLASLAFMLLIVKRFCEPRKQRRSWLVWFYDTSKQGLGAGLVHFANVFLAEEFAGDPCTWYIISFLLDSTIGLALVWAGIRISIRIGRQYRLPTLLFGEYGRPPSCVCWAHQCLVYCGLMGFAKIIITALMRLPYWASVRDMILSPITSPQARVVVVVLIIPFFVNALIFWVTDNFLMVKVRSEVASSAADYPIHREDKVMYQRMGSSSPSNSEADILINHASGSASDDNLSPLLLRDDCHTYPSPFDSDSSDVGMLGVHENLSSSPSMSPLHAPSPASPGATTVVPDSSVLVNVSPNKRQHAVHSPHFVHVRSGTKVIKKSV